MSINKLLNKMTTKKIEKEIEIKTKLIEKVASEISELKRLLDFSDKGYKEDFEDIFLKNGRKKEKINAKVGRIHWTEDFIDEENGEVVSIERSKLVSIDGIWVDRFGFEKKIVAELHEITEKESVLTKILNERNKQSTDENTN